MTKNALVTGASRGIGRAIALRLAADGAAVAVHHGGNEGAAKETVSLIEDAGGHAFPVAARFGEAGAVERLVDAVTSAFGDGLDILVNNAGISSHSSIGELTEEELDRLLAVNVKAPMLLVAAGAERGWPGGDGGVDGHAHRRSVADRVHGEQSRGRGVGTDARQRARAPGDHGQHRGAGSN